MTDASIRWIAGPVLRARTRDQFHIHDTVEVGEQRLLGEVIQLDGDEIVAQIYEDTTGLEPGDVVHGSGLPLSVPLGPGLLGHIFDGLLRPLELSGDRFVRPGAGMATSQVAQQFTFTPRVKCGDAVEPGGIIGDIRGDGPGQLCLVPPGRAGQLTTLAAAGEYRPTDVVATLRSDDQLISEIHFTQHWPVRKPRPIAARLPIAGPMITGQRILDTLFPVARGGRAAIPGGFGTGKTILQEALAKWCDADVIVYVGCGERGNEMAEVLDEFPALDDPRSGRPLMERTVIIANTSNMPVAAREASIYTAITVAEYFRDQGLHVALMADSTSRWAEALREISGRLGELPGEAGYPAYLSSRLAEFYERAARARTLSGQEGSVTIIGAISPPAGDFSEPVTMHTKRYVRSFWALDSDRAQARFYPAIHPLRSYSEDAAQLAHWWQIQGNASWRIYRKRILTLLEQQERLERMARIVGKDALPAAQQLTLLCAELVNDGFLRQSAFSEVDRFCSPARQTAMLRLLMRFIELAEQALDRGVLPERIAALPVLRRLQRMGEELGEEQIESIEIIWRSLEADFDTLEASADVR
jgi:V/A-type H+/Na+-transporting ATPase subunit A